MTTTLLERSRRTEAYSIRLERRADGRLWATRDGEAWPGWVRRLFPWSEPTRHVPLRDAGGHEVAPVADPDALDAASREALEWAAAEVDEETAAKGSDE